MTSDRFVDGKSFKPSDKEMRLSFEEVHFLAVQAERGLECRWSGTCHESGMRRETLVLQMLMYTA